MCLLIATANMIDKVVPFVSVIFIFVHCVSPAPATLGVNGVSSQESNQRNNSGIPLPDNTSRASLVLDVFDSNRTIDNKNLSTSEQTFSDRGQLQATPPTLKSTVKARKNNNDLYFCCPEEEDLEPITASSRRNKDRERNTKPPILKRGKIPETEEPSFERRPALLLRFFPDGTAVLISKFQLHLHVKPKQLKFEPGGESKDDLDFNPGLILNNGKSYEVTYRRLEAIPSSREQNVFDLDESEEREAYSENKDNRDHKFITTPETSFGTKSMSFDDKPFALQESTTEPGMTVTDSSMLETSVSEENNINISEKLSPTVGDSPFFIMTSEEMSSLQQQYDPALASPLKATTSTAQNASKSDIQTTTKIMQFTTTGAQETTVTTEPSNSHTATPTATTKCLSFKSQLSLALSTEDNIDNSLLKRHIFPTEDCNNSNSGISNPLAKFRDSDITTRASPTTLPIITRTPPEPPQTTQSYTRNNLVPYLSSQLSNHPSKPDVVVVTSLPVLIDLKSSRNQQVTDVPAWREVTVGVVRDQQGQPLKPRYNNWSEHLRGLRKKTENKFWNDFTTPKPGFRLQSREPIQQNFQQSPSQINRAFWTDLQRQIHMPDPRNKDKTNSQLYRTNPPQNYPVHKENEFQFWRIRTSNADSRWNSNGNSNVPEYVRTNGPLRNPHRNFENVQSRQNPQWNPGNMQQNNRRW